MSASQEKVRIMSNTNVGGPYFKLAFEANRLAKYARPGQFMLIKADPGLKPLLRKPLGFHRLEENRVEALYEVVGEGTEILSCREPGDYLDIIGPLGNGFDLCGTWDVGRGTKILIAGGIGVAPLMFLAEKLQSHNDTMTQRHKVIVLLGSKTKKDILCEKEFKSLGCEVKVATDDGSKGHKSFVTDLLSGILRSSQYAVRSTIYACGPKPMLKETARIAARHKIPCQVLLEEYMACGVGVCLGCAVKVRTQYSILNTQYQYKMVCKDGPVFDGGEVVWE